MPSRYWLNRVIAATAMMAGLLLAGCGSQPAPPPAGPPEVAFVTVQTERVVLTTELPGRTSAYLVAEIGRASCRERVCSTV